MGENENRLVVAQNRPIGRNPPSFNSLASNLGSPQTDLTVAAALQGPNSERNFTSHLQMEQHDHAEILFTSP